jgi:hypothetical protein
VRESACPSRNTSSRTRSRSENVHRMLPSATCCAIRSSAN